jgi:hypothetical protein
VQAIDERRAVKALRLASGKIRRFFYTWLRKEYVEQQLEERNGECNHCGNCCEILFKCPFLIRVDDGTSQCSIYDDKPGQCAAFPIDEKCLSDVDFDCTYTFGESEVVEIEPASQISS